MEANEETSGGEQAVVEATKEAISEGEADMKEEQPNEKIQVEVTEDQSSSKDSTGEGVTEDSDDGDEPTSTPDPADPPAEGGSDEEAGEDRESGEFETAAVEECDEITFVAQTSPTATGDFSAPVNEEPGNEEPEKVIMKSTVTTGNSDTDTDATSVTPLTGSQIKQLFSKHKINVRLQPCSGDSVLPGGAKTIPLSSLTAQTSQDTPTRSASVINLPTVFKQPQPAAPSVSEAAGESKKVSVYRVFNSASLSNTSTISTSALVGKKNTFMNPEDFASSVMMAKGPSAATKTKSGPLQTGDAPIKRKRGRPRLNQRQELRVNPIRPCPSTSKNSEAGSSGLKSILKSTSEERGRPNYEDPVSSQVKFSIADLPPEERPSFAFRRDLRRQLAQKSLEDRIKWALGKKNTKKEEVNKTSRSGRPIRRPTYVSESEGAEYDVSPTPPQLKTVVSPLPPPPRKRGRPRKIRPPEFPTQASPEEPMEAEESVRSPTKPANLSSAISAIEDSLLSEDYIMRNLEYWESKKKELEQRRNLKKQQRGPPKSVNVVVQSSSVVEEEMAASNTSQEIRRVSDVMVMPVWPTVVLPTSAPMSTSVRSSAPLQSSSPSPPPPQPPPPPPPLPPPTAEEQRRLLPDFRPIMPRPAMTQEERLENFRRRSEKETKMRLIRGVDFIPVHPESEEEYKKFMQKRRDKPVKRRAEEETDGDRELNQLIDEARRERRAAKRKARKEEEEEEEEENEVQVLEEQPDVDIDAEDDDSPPQPVLQSVMSLSKKASPQKRRKVKPISHGTLTDSAITRFRDPDVLMRPADGSEGDKEEKRSLIKDLPAEEEEEDDDDEPPIIWSKPTSAALAKRTSVGGVRNSMMEGSGSHAPDDAVLRGQRASAAGHEGHEEGTKIKTAQGRKRQTRKTPTWPFGPSAPEEKRVFRRPSKPSTKIAPTTERRLIYSLMQNAAQLALKQSAEEGKVDEVEPLSYIVLESESESESDEEGEDGEKKKVKSRKNFSCAAVTIKLAATNKSSLVFAPPTDVYDEATHIEYEEGMDSGVEENGVLWKFPTQYFNGAKYQEIAPVEEPDEPVSEPRKRNTNRTPSCSMNWAAPDYGVLPPNNKCPHCNRSFNDNFRLWRHLISHSDKKPFVCSLCGKGHRLPEYLSYHFRLHHSSTEDLLPCPHCPKRALFYSQLEAHLLNKHEAPRPYQCGQCVQAFALEASLENHVRSFHDPQPHMCDFCGHTFTDDVARLYHQRSHAQERPFQCSDCNKAFRSKVLLGHHRMVEHEIERQHECPKCLKSFFFLKDMHKHMAASHTEPEPYQCGHCPAQFARKVQLTRHVDKSHRASAGGVQTNRPFRCQVCQACFVSERLLLRHQASVHADRHFPATPQPQQQQQQHQHLAPGPSHVESGPTAEGKRKMFSCRYCDLLFTARTAVTQHIESVHIDTMALRCRHCRQPCVNHADLERHILEHKERRETLQLRRPNRRLCVACGEMLASRAALEKHLKEEHDELVQFMCPICGEFFLTNQLYYEHTCRQETVSEIRRTRYSGHDDSGEVREGQVPVYSSDDEAAAQQQPPVAAQAAPMEGQEEAVESYPEWQRRPQWPEYPREESGHYYTNW